MGPGLFYLGIKISLLVHPISHTIHFLFCTTLFNIPYLCVPYYTSPHSMLYIPNCTLLNFGIPCWHFPHSIRSFCCTFCCTFPILHCLIIYTIFYVSHSAPLHSVFHAVHSLFHSASFHIPYCVLPIPHCLCYSYSTPSHSVHHVTWFPILHRLILYIMFYIPYSAQPHFVYHVLHSLFHTSSFYIPCCALPITQRLISYAILYVCHSTLLYFSLPY